MKLELSSEKKRVKGRYTWTDFFGDLLAGEGEICLKFIEIDGDSNVKNHTILFILGDRPERYYLYKNGAFTEQSSPRQSFEKPMIKIPIAQE